MSDYPQHAANAGDRYLKALAATQEHFLNFVATVRHMTPQPPMAPQAKMAAQTSKQFADAGFAFASKLLEQQEEFAETFFGHSPAGTKEPAKTRRSPAKKAASKKSAAGKPSRTSNTSTSSAASGPGKGSGATTSS